MRSPARTPDLAHLAELQPLHAVSRLLDDGAPLSHRNFRFEFACWGAYVMAEYCGDDDNDAHLTLSSSLGRLPFSSQSGATARSNILAVLQGANTKLGRVFQVRPGGDIFLNARIALPKPVTAAGLIAGITLLFLPLKPYLYLLSAVTSNAPVSRLAPRRF